MPESNWSIWVMKADHDRLAIRNNMAAEETPWDVVCFHAQQAAEKVLKAYLVKNGCQPRKTHDLLVLLAECAALDPGLSVLRDECRLLIGLAVQSRYPGGVPEPGEDDGKGAVEAAERVYAMVRWRLQPSSTPPIEGAR